MNTLATSLPADPTQADIQRLSSGKNPQAIGKEFESLFVSLMLKEMRQSAGEDGLFGGENSDIYGGMFDTYMAQHITQGSSLGVDKMVETYLTAQHAGDGK